MGDPMDYTGDALTESTGTEEYSGHGRQEEHRFEWTVPVDAAAWAERTLDQLRRDITFSYRLDRAMGYLYSFPPLHPRERRRRMKAFPKWWRKLPHYELLLRNGTLGFQSSKEMHRCPSLPVLKHDARPEDVAAVVDRVQFSGGILTGEYRPPHGEPEFRATIKATFRGVEEDPTSA